MKPLNGKLQDFETSALELSHVESTCQLVETFCDRVRPHGIDMKPYSAESIAKFQSFSLEKKQKVHFDFFKYASDIFLAIEKNVNLRSNAELISFIVDKNNGRVTDEVMSLVKDTDVVEIYSSELIQTFRNLEFMRLCSYTLLDLISFEFHELYERSSWITQELFGAAKIMLDSPTIVLPLNPKIPVHVMRERFSAEKREFEVQFRYFCAILGERGERSSFLVLQSAQHLVDEQVKDKVRFI